MRVSTLLIHSLLAFLPFSLPALCSEPTPDPRGYIIYCPCMGLVELVICEEAGVDYYFGKCDTESRFGNQADHFLGSLGFAKRLDRTLILPHWVEYDFGQPKSRQVEFDRYFQVEPLREFHRVIPMDQFMMEFSTQIWPDNKRISFCWSPRTHGKGDPEDCNAKEGNPFGPFWDSADIDFVGSEFYGTIGHYDPYGPGSKPEWDKRFPPSKYPVLAFTGAPANFPVSNEDRFLHQYLHWSNDVDDDAMEFIEKTLPKGPFVGIHLRNDLDWKSVCEHVGSGNHLFASPQCLGYGNEHGKLTKEICSPPDETILQQIVNAVDDLRANSVFVATDRDPMIEKINKALAAMKLKAKAYSLEPNDPHISLAILAKADYFIGNCVSSFSAFVKRERDTKDLQSGFWAFGQTAGKTKTNTKSGSSASAGASKENKKKGTHSEL